MLGLDPWRQREKTAGTDLLFLPYASSGFAPIETMPDWLRAFAGHRPMTPIIDPSWALLNGQAPGSEWRIGILWRVAFIMLTVWLAAVIFPKEVARQRHPGPAEQWAGHYRAERQRR